MALMGVNHGPVSVALLSKAAKQVDDTLLHIAYRAEISNVSRHTSHWNWSVIGKAVDQC
jgi:exonuclease VII large subunit